jgi:alpha-mannosidase
VRPEAEERIRRLVRSGRLAIGPWQTLVDEFLVSGESIIRNLERGLARGDELGGAMRVGYLPDMFGHVAQMPQILRLAGIDQAVVWRGVPAAIDHHAFTWEGIDGSRVRTEYLPRGYGNAKHVGAAEDLEALREALRPFYGDDPLLAMCGDDHTEPSLDLTRLVGPGVELTTLPGYLENASRAELPHWQGELRSGARANLLMGVTSARIDLKATAARAERTLGRYAEPLQALYCEHWPQRMLDLAWSRVFQNSAHDSICGCSTDDVSAQVLVRYAEAEQIARGLADEAVREIARSVERGSLAVVNPSPRERTETVELPAGLAQVTVPPLGWASVPLEGDGAPHANATLAADVAPDGTITLRADGLELKGVGRLVNGRDVGDSYNYAPPEDDVVVDKPDDVRNHFDGRAGVVVRSYHWQGTPVDVAMHVQLRPGEPFCRVRISFDNFCRNHRLRFHIPLPEPATVSAAEGQFAVVERGLEAEGGHGEVPLATFPARGFVDAGGVAVLLDHVMEYEVVDGRELALTLLRSVGVISRPDNPYRKVNAGPEVPLPAAQCLGPWSVGFALFPHTGSWLEAGVLEQMERYQHPFLTALGTGERSAAAEGAGLELGGDGVMLSALRRRGDSLEARIVNETPEPRTALLAGESIELRPWEIKTVALGQ